MDIFVNIEETFIEGSPLFVAYPEDEIYMEAVGVGDSPEEAIDDFIQSFNQMMYSDNGVPILICTEI